MPLPETIAVRFTEEDAGYVTVRPVVRQVFRLAELVDMVLSVTGKNALRVQQIFRAGTVVYNGFRYSWEGFTCEGGELAALLAGFPDDDPSRAFNADAVTAVTLEIGGGTQMALGMRAAIDEIGERHPGRRVAVVSHGAAIIAYLSDVLQLEPGRLRMLPYYTSISVVRALGDRRMVGALGDVAHLE